MLKLDTIVLDENTTRMIRESVCSELIENDFHVIYHPIEWISWFTTTDLKGNQLFFICRSLVIPISKDSKQVVPLEVWQVNDEHEFHAYLRLVNPWAQELINQQKSAI